MCAGSATRAHLLCACAVAHACGCTCTPCTCTWVKCCIRKQTPSCNAATQEDLFDPKEGSLARQCQSDDCGAGPDPFFVNNAFLSFKTGSPFLYRLMEQFVQQFNGSLWGWNGPRLVSSMYTSMLCNEVYEFADPDCGEIKVLPTDRLAPFDWGDIRGNLTSTLDTEAAMRMLTKNSEIWGIHMYHNQWQDACVPQDSLFERIMTDHCPVVAATHANSIFCPAIV